MPPREVMLATSSSGDANYHDAAAQIDKVGGVVNKGGQIETSVLSVPSTYISYELCAGC